MKNREGVACSVSVIIVLLLLLLLLCCSCTKRVCETQYVEQPVYLHDTLRSTIYSHDTTIVKDSVYFAIKGDTIVRERYNTIERIKVAHDTIMRFVEKPVEVVREKNVEKQVEVNRIYWWQKALIWMGGICVVGLALLLVKKKMVRYGNKTVG